MFNGENVVFIKLLSYCQVQWMKRAMVSVQESTKMLRRLLMKHSWKKQKLSYRRKKLSYQKRHTLWLDVLLKRPFSGQIRDSGLRRFMEDRSWKSPSSAAKFRAALRGSAAKVATSEASCSRGGTLDVMAEKKHFVPVRFLEKHSNIKFFHGHSRFHYPYSSFSATSLFQFWCPGPSFQSFGDFSCWPGKAAEGTGVQQRTAGQTANLRGPIMEIPSL